MKNTLSLKFYIAIVSVAAIITVSFAACGNNFLCNNKAEADRALPVIENIGQVVEFGVWRGEPIKWRVLDIQDGRALVLAEDILAVRQFAELKSLENSDYKMTWEDSDIRKWLSEDFFDEAFSKNEQNAILLTKFINPDRRMFPAEGEGDTNDKIFLLRLDEINKYFPKNAVYYYNNNYYYNEDYQNDDLIAEIRMTDEDLDYITLVAERDFVYFGNRLTDLKKEMKDQYLNKRVAWRWWLMSPWEGSLNDRFYVDDEGYVYSYKNFIFKATDDVWDYGGVRPAMYLALMA